MNPNAPILGGFTPPAKPQSQTQAEITRDEERQHAISRDPKWEVLIDYFNSRIVQYEEGLLNALDSGLTLEQVGEKYLVSKMVANELRAAVSKIQETAKAVDSAKKQQQAEQQQ